MERPNRDEWLILLGVLQPIAGLGILFVLASLFWMGASDALVIFPLASFSSAVAVVVAHALGIGFSRIGVAVFVLWMVVTAFGFAWTYSEALGAC
jgi:hypothetical protein